MTFSVAMTWDDVRLNRTTRTYAAGERIQSMRGSFRHAARRAKLPDTFRPRGLRHRRVTTWLAEGKSAVLVKEAVDALHAPVEEPSQRVGRGAATGDRPPTEGSWCLK
jgi:hypothetical protein